MKLGMHTVTRSVGGEVTVEIPANYPDGTNYTWELSGSRNGNGTVSGGKITIHLGVLNPGSYTLVIKVPVPQPDKVEDFPIDIPDALVLRYENRLLASVGIKRKPVPGTTV